MHNSNPAVISEKLVRSTVPSMRNHGEDFTQWQKNARDKLMELVGYPLKACDLEFSVEYDKVHEDYREIRFTFQSEENYFVPCHLLIPKNARPKCPVFICVQGHTSGMHVSLGKIKFNGDERNIKARSSDFAIQFVKRGYAALALEQRYMGECGGDENGGTGCANLWSPLRSLLVGRTAIGERVWDIGRAIDVLKCEFTQLDTDNIMCMGHSGGGTAVFYTACIDERVKLVIASGSVCTYKDSIAAMQHCCCNYIPNIARYFDMGDLGGLIAPRKLIVVAGKEDPIFPIAGVYESFDIIKGLYKAAGVEENARLVVGNGNHMFFENETHAVLSEMV